MLADSGYKERLVPVIEGLVLLLVALSVRLLYLDHEPIHDELQHLLAGQSWARDGTFAVADGSYTRGALYTALVGIVYGAFDQSVTAVRMMSVILGALWVVAVFLWCRLRVGRGVAWIAALLFCFAPGALFLSQFIRFYALHGLLFWLGAIAVFEVVEYPKSALKTVTLLIAAAAALLVSLHLQPITLIGAVGLGLYAALRFAPTILGRASTDHVLRRWLWAGLLGAIIVAAGAVATGVAQKLLEMYRWAPLWNSSSGPLRYHWMFVAQYPLLWGAIPAACVLVFAKPSRPGMFCAAVFCSALLIHSFAGMKAERFVYYVVPFFFVLSAILLVELGAFLRPRIDTLLSRLSSPDGGLHSAGSVGLLALVGLFLLVSNPAIRTTADILRGRDAPEHHWSRYSTSWGGAKQLLEPIVADASIVVTTQGLHLLYHFDRLDIELSASRLSDLYVGRWDDSKEFMRDPRTGQPVISSSASFSRLRSCFASGAVVIHENAWENRIYVSPAVAETITATTSEVAAARPFGLRVFRWENADFDPGAECSQLPETLRTLTTLAGRDERP